MPRIMISHGQSAKNFVDYLCENSLKRVLVITSSRAWEQSKISSHLENFFPDIQVILFHDFCPNPTFEEIHRACLLAEKHNTQAVLGLGGGTAMDIAKSVVVMAGLSEDAAKALILEPNSEIPVRKSHLIAIPTTAGSGSEATHFAVVYLDCKKYSLADPGMLPDISLIDGTLSYSMPSDLAASCGLDALCQAMESYWSVNATEISKNYALSAIKFLVLHIEDAVLLKSPKSCNAVAEAASLAGQAINISKTTAAHAFSYYLTYTHNIPHGHAVSLCFPGTALCNYHSDELYLDAAELSGRFERLFNITQTEGIDQFVSWFTSLMRKLGLETSLKKMGFNPTEEMDEFLNSVNLERLKNNPAKIDTQYFTKIILEEA